MEDTPSNRLFLAVAKRLHKGYCHDEIFHQISYLFCINFDLVLQGYIFIVVIYILQEKRADEVKPSEEKIKTLKKRNAELAAIARRLEEKAKQLQQENQKVSLTYHRITLS